MLSVENVGSTSRPAERTNKPSAEVLYPPTVVATAGAAKASSAVNSGTAAREVRVQGMLPSMFSAARKLLSRVEPLDDALLDTRRERHPH